MTESSVLHLTTAQDYYEFIKSKDLLVIHFQAPWAEQCKQMNDVLEEIKSREEYKNARYAQINAEDVPEVSLKSNVTAVPTILLIKDGKIVTRVDGANPAELTDKIKIHLNILIPGTTDDLNARLLKLINQASCMVFMKGNPFEPRCGFSKTIISTLNTVNADYQTFDILKDNDVREGLKKFSNWPTYPQLYVHGKLIGGLDIVLELNERGRLEDILPKKRAHTP